MCGLGDFAFLDFLERVDPLAVNIERVHEMHLCCLSGVDRFL